MNMQTLGAGDRRYLILGAVVALMGLLSFLDPSGSWGAVVLLGILGGLLAAFVAVQPQIAPTVKLPASKGTVLLVAGALAAAGFVIAGLTWISYVFAVTRVFSILFDIGLVASLVLLWYGWQAYQAEQGQKPAAPPAAPPPPAA
jgi:hypothetical protein